jgi:hypothetical protein
LLSEARLESKSLKSNNTELHKEMQVLLRAALEVQCGVDDDCFVLSAQRAQRETASIKPEKNMSSSLQLLEIGTAHELA